MGKATKKIKEKKDNKRTVFWMSMILLVIMVLSVLGFALSGSGGNLGDSSSSATEIPFQEFQDPNTGTVFWGAIRGGEQFVFLDINQFANYSDMAELSNSIKEHQSIGVYTSSNFSDSSSEFLIKKALKGIRIDTKTNYVLDCSIPTLVFGTEIIEGCYNFVQEGNNTYEKAEALVYYLIQE